MLDRPSPVPARGGAASDLVVDDDWGVIAATYFDGRSNGTVGIIGPTRMRYSKAITAVDIAAIAVARVLKDVN